MLTRRQLLAGTVGGVTLAGGSVAATQASRIRRYLSRAGVLGSERAPPDDAAPPPTYATFRSTFMHADVRYGVAEPAGVRPAAVVVCLHGRSTDERYAFDNMGVHRFVAAAHHPFAVASVAGGDHSYWHARRDGTDAGRMVTDELVPLLRARFPGARIALLGWSMGGYGALLAATHLPGYAAVCATGAAVWRTAGQTSAGSYDDPADFTRNSLFTHAAALNDPRVRIDTGRDDPVRPAVDDLAKKLPRATYRVIDGAHNDATFRSALPAQLAFIVLARQRYPGKK